MSSHYMHTFSRQQAEIGRAIDEIGAETGARIIGALAGALRTLLRWQRRDQDRRRLARMEPHLLADMGISREQAERLSAKMFWVA